MKEGPKTLNEIAEREYDALYKYCLKRSGGDEQLAGECAAEALLRAERLGDPPRHPNIMGWLKKTASNVVHEKLREQKEYYRCNVSLDDVSERNGLARFYERENAFLESLWDGEARDPDDEEIDRIKHEILGILPAADRELMEMKYEKGMSLSRIAEMTGRSKDAVRVRLSRLADKVTAMVNNYFDRE